MIQNYETHVFIQITMCFPEYISSVWLSFYRKVMHVFGMVTLSFLEQIIVLTMHIQKTLHLSMCVE